MSTITTHAAQSAMPAGYKPAACVHCGTALFVPARTEDANCNGCLQNVHEFDIWKLETLLDKAAVHWTPTPEEREEIEDIEQQRIEAETSIEYWDGTEWVEREAVPSHLARAAVDHYNRNEPSREWRAM